MRGIRQRVLPFFLFLFALSFGACATTNSGQIASQTGLDPDLFGVLTLEVGGTELAIFVVYINDRALGSRISADLGQSLLPYVGENALYINATVKSVVTTFPFFPSAFRVEQEGRAPFLPGGDDWVELTEGFQTGAFQVNPMGASYGSGSAGVLVVGEHIDPGLPFWVVYQGQRVRFEISEPMRAVEPPISPPVLSTEPARSQPITVIETLPAIDVSGIEDVLTRGDLSSAVAAALLSLDPRLVETLVVSTRNGELRLLLVLLEPGIEQSALSETLLARLRPLVGTGAIMVWAGSPTGATFSPYYFWVAQAERNYFFVSNLSLLELTAGFSLRDHPLAASEVTAGILLLPGTIDPRLPFTLYYGSTATKFFAKPLP